MAQALTRDGRPWVPRYLDLIDPDACIGCGRCYKVCGRGVLAPIEAMAEDDEDDDGYGEECTTTIMSVADSGACIGCEACAKVCAKKAHKHVAAA